MSTGTLPDACSPAATARAMAAYGATRGDRDAAIAARGNSLRSADSKPASVSPTSTKHTPVDVAATRMRPTGDWMVVQSIEAPRPPWPYVDGRMPGSLTALYMRLGEPNPAENVASVTDRP